MKTAKTSELSGAALDWAVAKCKGWIKGDITHPKFCRLWRDQIRTPAIYPSTSWAQGGPIIERERIATSYHPNPNTPGWEPWVATTKSYRADGPTPLIAAMRCYVASKLGDEVEVPEELSLGPNKKLTKAKSCPSSQIPSPQKS